MERADVWNELVCELGEERAVPVEATLQDWPPEGSIASSPTTATPSSRPDYRTASSVPSGSPATDAICVTVVGLKLACQHFTHATPGSRRATWSGWPLVLIDRKRSPTRTVEGRRTPGTGYR